ncbi:MAG: hypothetical protein KatS3mg105_3835 [Gemmatales bacterium]|nr:MAG: hypothetical protein KatS3mg105_3835 [Gemmatales bacterium]
MCPASDKKIHSQFANIDRYFSQRLGGIRVDEHSFRTGLFGNLANRLKRADLVIRVHNADKNGLWPNALNHSIDADLSEAVYADHADLAALPFEKSAGLHSRRVLDSAGDNVGCPTADSPL